MQSILTFECIDNLKMYLHRIIFIRDSPVLQKSTDIVKAKEDLMEKVEIMEENNTCGYLLMIILISFSIPLLVFVFSKIIEYISKRSKKKLTMTRESFRRGGSYRTTVVIKKGRKTNFHHLVEESENSGRHKLGEKANFKLYFYRLKIMSKKTVTS